MGLLSNIFNKKNNSYNDENIVLDKNSEYYGYTKEFKDWEELNKKYEKVINMHFKLLEKIRMNYTIVNNLGDVFSPTNGFSYKRL